jgi:propanediol utilization protein
MGRLSGRAMRGSDASEGMMVASFNAAVADKEDLVIATRKIHLCQERRAKAGIAIS